MTTLIGPKCLQKTKIHIESPLGRATPPPFYFWSARQFQGGEIKHAIHSRRFRQEDMDSMDSMSSMHPKTSWRHVYDISSCMQCAVQKRRLQDEDIRATCIQHIILQAVCNSKTGTPRWRHHGDTYMTYHIAGSMQFKVGDSKIKISWRHPYDISCWRYKPLHICAMWLPRAGSIFQQNDDESIAKMWKCHAKCMR